MSYLVYLMDKYGFILVIFWGESVAEWTMLMAEIAPVLTRVSEKCITSLSMYAHDSKRCVE